MPEEIISNQNTEELLKSLTVQVSEESREKLGKIQEWYRSPSMSHTVRLMIDDVFGLVNNPGDNPYAR